MKDRETMEFDRDPISEQIKNYVALLHYRRSLELPEEVTEEYRLLAQGEYNRNYVFTHPITGQELILRVNFGSQMHLENQIQYEYDALRLLERSGRTPRPFFVDGSLKYFPQGIMVMEFLPGHELDYRRELMYAADCLADIHSVPIPMDVSGGLVTPPEPLKAILEECEAMAKVYMDSELGRAETKGKLRQMLDRGWERLKAVPEFHGYRCCINTELNSTNFLINGDSGNNYLIDWEKPIYGEPAQDLGHFLAPTTTFWKTDVILTGKEMETFIDWYLQAVNGRFDVSGSRERVHTFIPITCLRGVTWCAMAWVEYQQPERALINQSTFRKLEAYLSDDFLDSLPV